MTKQATYERRLSALRGHLRAKKYYMALEALEYAREFHVGTRKGGGPEMEHQVDMAFHVIDLPGIIHRQETIATIFLHDTIEDYGSHHEAIILARFGALVHSGVMSVTKKIPVFVDGVKVAVTERDEDVLFAEMANHPIGSIVKPVDRSHNQSTMGGVFTAEKQLSYVDFTDERIIPMMHIARHKFPRQYRAYALLQDKLHSQQVLVRSWAQAKAA